MLPKSEGMTGVPIASDSVTEAEALVQRGEHRGARQQVSAPQEVVGDHGDRLHGSAAGLQLLELHRELAAPPRVAAHEGEAELAALTPEALGRIEDGEVVLPRLVAAHAEAAAARP